MNEPTLHVKTLLQLFVLQHLVFGNDESQASVQDPTGDVGSVVSSFLFIKINKIQLLYTTEQRVFYFAEDICT
jgi:hypothetical protein